MTSIHNSDSDIDYRFAYDMSNLYKNKKPIAPIAPIDSSSLIDTSVYSIIFNNPDFSTFKFLIQLAKLDDMFDDPQFNSTVFICPDKYLPMCDSTFLNMDKLSARNLILYNTLNGRLDQNTLKSSSIMSLQTRIPPEVHSNLLITTLQNQPTVLNGATHLIGQIDLCNGLVQVVDGLLVPDILDSVINNKQTCKNNSTVSRCMSQYAKIKLR